MHNLFSPNTPSTNFLCGGQGGGILSNSRNRQSQASVHCRCSKIQGRNQISNAELTPGLITQQRQILLSHFTSRHCYRRQKQLRRQRGVLDNVKPHHAVFSLLQLLWSLASYGANTWNIPTSVLITPYSCTFSTYWG